MSYQMKNKIHGGKCTFGEVYSQYGNVALEVAHSRRSYKKYLYYNTTLVSCYVSLSSLLERIDLR